MIPPLRGMVEQLKSSLRKMNAFLSGGADLGERLQRLDRTGNEIDLLGAITEIVDRRGMVEFRPVIGAIVERLETRCFEIAVFGRVSSGKSSLLNHILGTQVLPVGVTPVTAVPTMVVFGPEPAVDALCGRVERACASVSVNSPSKAIHTGRQYWAVDSIATEVIPCCRRKRVSSSESKLRGAEDATCAIAVRLFLLQDDNDHGLLMDVQACYLIKCLHDSLLCGGPVENDSYWRVTLAG
jgi:hypothetical protein